MKKRQRLQAAGQWEEFLAAGAAENVVAEKPVGRTGHEARLQRAREARKLAKETEARVRECAEKPKRRVRNVPSCADDNVVARALLKKVPRPSSLPAPVHIPASSILARLKSKLPTSAPVLPRGTPILPPSKPKREKPQP